MTRPNPTDTIHYSRDFSGFIWKLKVDPVYGYLWIEMRDEHELSVSIFRINIETGEDEQIILGETLIWWDSLIGAYEDIIIVHRIEDQKNPGPGVIRLLDAKKGREHMTIRDAVFHGQLESVISYRLSDNPEREYQEDLKQWAMVPPNDPSIVSIPSVFPETHAYHQTVSTFLRGIDIVSSGPIGYQEYQSSILIAYHQGSADKLSRHLLWIRDGEVYLHQMLDQSMKGYSQESFLTIGRYLIFVVDRKQLVIHLLT